jgi:hypothetical protein
MGMNMSVRMRDHQVELRHARLHQHDIAGPAQANPAHSCGLHSGIEARK